MGVKNREDVVGVKGGRGDRLDGGSRGINRKATAEGDPGVENVVVEEGSCG